MSRKVTKTCHSLIIASMLVMAAALGGCSGSDGAQGPAGPPGASVSPLATLTPESCGTCHAGAGPGHMAAYQTARNGAVNATSALAGTFAQVSVTPNATTVGSFDIDYTFTFTNTVNVSTAFASGTGTKSAKWVQFTPDATLPTGGTFPAGGSLTMTPITNGYELKGTLPFDPTTSTGDIYVYFATDPLVGASDTITGGHVQMYNEVYNAGVKFGTWTYTAAVNVSSCEKCHGTPYLKHGYRGAQAVGLDDFVACKNCHYDTLAGSDAEIFFGDASYPYTANIMTDVHASHMNEFPYPQSLANCVTCHAYDSATAPNDQFDTTLSDANYDYPVCTTCHANVASTNTVVVKPLLSVLPNDFHQTLNFSDYQAGTAHCYSCHSAGNSFGAPTFQQVHPGYDTVKYASLVDAAAAQVDPSTDNLRYTYFIDSITYDATASTLTIKWGAKDAAGAAQNVLTSTPAAGAPAFLGLPSDRNNESEGVRIMVGYYGWGSNNVADYDNIRKDDIIADSTYDATAGMATTVFPLSTKLTTYASTKLDVGIIGVPEIVDGSSTHMVAVKSLTEDITLATGATATRISAVSNARCNTCHDNIIMHAGDSHGHTTVGNENACVFCHNTSSSAGHYAQQSKSIDSYVHAVHAFPNPELDANGNPIPNDVTPVNSYNPFIFPTFTLQDCEACHTSGSYDVPNQDNWIGSVIGGPEGDVTVGPASRACGSCHRALDLKFDNTNAVYGDTGSLNAHTKVMGYRVPTADSPYVDVMNQIETLLNP